MRISLICFVVGFWMSSPVYGQLAADFEAEQTSRMRCISAKFKNLSIVDIALLSVGLWQWLHIKTSHTFKSICHSGILHCLSFGDNSLGMTDKKCKDNYIEVKSSFVADFIVSDTLICAGSTAKI